MENVLDLYHRPEAAAYPLVCVDETSKQHIQEVREPLGIVKGSPGLRYDAEYQRNGVSNLFMIFAPLQGFRHIEVTDKRTSIDFAHICRDFEWMCIFQMPQRLCLFATISILISRLRCIKLFTPMKPGVLLKRLSFTIHRNMAVG